jgi:hypothetical protein
MTFRLTEHCDAHTFLIFGVIWRTQELIEQEAIKQRKGKSLMADRHCSFPTGTNRKHIASEQALSLGACLENVHLWMGSRIRSTTSGIVPFQLGSAKSKV